MHSIHSRSLKHRNKGAIELSANFIIVIVISIVILVGGLSLFFKMGKNAKQYVDTLDSQTEDDIKNLMLSNGGKAAVYPQDPTISVGDSSLVGVGITNIYDTETTFKIFILKIKYYSRDDTEGEWVLDAQLPLYHTISADSNNIILAPKAQIVKGVLLSVPKGSPSGQYVYTIEVDYVDAATLESKPYGVMQVYANTK